MRIALIITIAVSILFIGSKAEAVTGEQVRFDWSWGQPTLTDDVTNLCNNQAVSRFDWSWGRPTIVYDATATCTAVVVSSGVPTGIKVQVQGVVTIQGGQVTVQ